MTLSTHVLDTARGVPAMSVAVTLMRDEAVLAHGVTDADGRYRPDPSVPLHAGAYRLTFAVAEYFRAAGVTLADPPFLDVVTIDFGMADAGHHHVPLLVSPFGYSTYRGS